MSLNLRDKQKSPKRRFLLLDVIRLVAVVAVGLLIIIFYKKIDLNLSNTQKMIVGGLFVVYGVLRFTLSLKNQPNE